MEITAIICLMCTIVSYPTLGGIMVWQKGDTLSENDGAGHVAVEIKGHF